MKKILIIGASGFLGTKLYLDLSKKYEVVGSYTSHPKDKMIHLDLSDPNQIDKFITEIKPDVVIHAAGNPDLDYCEKHSEETENLHHMSVRYVVEACAKTRSKLIYVSSTYVFSGDKAPYRENDSLGEPINEYGKAKGKAEQDVKTLANSVILRFDFIYGYNGKDFSNGLLGRLMEGGSIYAANEQKRKPLFVDDVSTAIDKIIEKDANGVFHLAGPDNITKYELYVQLAEILGLKLNINPMSEKDQVVKQVARRPKDTSLLTDRLEELGMVCTPIKESLLRIREQFLSNPHKLLATF